MIKQVAILYCNSCERPVKGRLLPKGWERVGKDPPKGPYTIDEDQIHRCDECTALVRLPVEKMREFLQMSAVRRFLGLGSCEDDSGEKEPAALGPYKRRYSCDVCHESILHISVPSICPHCGALSTMPCTGINKTTGKNSATELRVSTDTSEDKTPEKDSDGKNGPFAIDGPTHGYCPVCGAASAWRHQGGEDTCENGHRYKSDSALKEKPSAEDSEAKS